MTTSSDADETLFDPDHAADEWLRIQIAAGRLPPEPTPEEIAEVARIVGPALRRMAVRRRDPAA